MSQKSANMARRLFAAMPTQAPLPHKEKEISPVPEPFARTRTGAGAVDIRQDSSGSGSGTGSDLRGNHDDRRLCLYDYGDCNRAAKRIFRELDAEYREKVIEPYRKYQRELRFKAALYQLRNHPELQATLRAIRLYKKKEKIFSALKIRGETYKQRFFQLTKILKIST